ncbi:adhesion G protein-coupled receptor G3-like isoform X2 [Xiphophorus maculatus]|uniref:Adhesion G protein-coupled receptor G3-like n=1 Tax=Xiphophorus maculatus TaxID=8083 RepID=A0A3B5QP34_XIPMA|nr:adhesion G protein-coupled receptor G3-like isoform X2 [Xiphophorus maculatus]
MREKTIIPVLVSLLLHQSRADQVCVNISEYNLNVTVPYGHMTEKRTGEGAECENDEEECFFQCVPTNETWFHGSFGCLNCSVTNGSYNITVYTIHGNILNTVCYHAHCREDSILPLIHRLKEIDDAQKELGELLYIRDSCPSLFRTSYDIKKVYVILEKQIIHEIMNMTEFEGGSSKTYNLKYLSVNVSKISDAVLNVSEDMIPMKAPQLWPNNDLSVPEVWIPVNALKHIPQEQRVIGLVSYMDPSQFQFSTEDFRSMVLRIETLGESRLQNLKPPIQMIFRVVKPEGNVSQLLCRYFDEDNGFAWKEDGCETEIDPDQVTCNCSHATPFAVLLIRTPIDGAHWKILSYISYIGCGISLFFGASSLVVYVFNRSHKMDTSMSIHVSLSGALFLLNSTFLLTEWGPTVEPDWVCEFIAALMHYSLLCCLTWMAIEALHLYLLLIKVYNTYYKCYLLKLSLVGWGIPAIIVSLSLSVKNVKQFYGVTELTMSDTNQTNSICWITDDTYFYSLNLVYFTLIFIFNSGILMAVASSICKMKKKLKTNSKLQASASRKSKGVPQRFSASCQSGLTLLGLTCLMGTTWGLAFLGSGYVNYAVLYLFCILNSLQGFFIFVWICLSAKKQRRKEMEQKVSLITAVHSDTKMD